MDITRALCQISKTLGANFTLNDKPITYEEVFSTKGLLPAMMRRADQLASLCLGYGLGISFDEADKSILGVQIKLDEVTPNVLRIMCVTDVICELMYSASSTNTTPLDELLYD